MALMDIISRTKGPVTSASLASDLRTLGIAAGDLILAHSSLSSLGWVNGGPVTVIQALLDAVGPSGTIVMPAHSSGLTDPAGWRSPPVPLEWVDTIRATMPAYDPRTTPAWEVGKVAELFRTWPGVLRSGHPSTSVAAFGPLAEEVTRIHPLTDTHGPNSPLGALYRLDAKILLMGVDFDTCTSLHLAEHMLWPDRPRERNGAPLIVDGKRQWVSFETLPLIDSDHFLPIGLDVLQNGIATSGALGEGRGILGSMKQIVDHAISVWSAKPKGLVT